MRTFLRRTIIPTLLLGLFAAPALAAIVPEVRDEGGFFSADAVRQANGVIVDIQRDFKHDLLIETFKTVPADKIEEFKKLDRAGQAKFYDDWAKQRARTAKVNGVYVLIVKEPGHLQAEVGNETREKVFTIENRNKLAETMIKKFREAKEAKDDADKQKFYDQALLDGVRYVHSTMKSNIGNQKTGIDNGGAFHGAPMNPHPANVPPVHHQAGLLGGIGGLICVGLLIFAGAWIVIGLIRSFTGGGYGGGGYGGGGGGGGGFLTGLLGGMFGAMAGSWIYNNFFGSGSSGWGSGGGWGSQAYGGEQSSQPQDTDYSGTGGDTGGGDDPGGGGGDTGGGGDFGGGDSGGGGGDFGGGGGDFGGGGGGGDF